jgi:hypothetical protein
MIILKTQFKEALFTALLKNPPAQVTPSQVTGFMD